MAEEVKKRGRPPKKKVETEVKNTNEKKEQITMAQEPTVTINQVQNAWLDVLKTSGARATNGMMKQAVNSAMLSNPFIQNQRVKSLNGQASVKSKQEIQQALINPTNSERTLREISNHLYFTNFVYNNLLRLERDIPTYYHYATPQYVEKEEMKKDAFKKEMRFVNQALEAFEPQLTFKTINMQVQLEGKCSYLVRKSYDYPKKVNYFLLEKLLPDEIKITGLGSKQKYIVSFNMMVFMNPMYDVSQYPPYIQEIWEEMKQTGMISTNNKTNQLKFNPNGTISPNHMLEYVNDNYFYWVELNQEDCFTFGQDLATPMCFPSTVGLFLDLKELDDYRWLMGSLMSKGVTSILTGEVPLDKDAKAGSDATIITPDLIQFYDSLFSKTVSANVMTYFAPFKNFDLHNIDSQPDNMDIVYNRLRDLVATSGNAALLSINDKPSVSMTKATQSISASRGHYLTLQFQQFLNNVINNQFDLKYQYKITLWGDIFDTSDNLKVAKELLQNGVTSMLPRVLSAFNQSVEDMKTINDYIDVSGIVVYARNTDKQTNQKETTQEVGRAEIEDRDIENDSTAASKDSGNNVSDIKEFKREDNEEML